MKLRDIIASLDSFDPEETIYAAEPWTLDSLATTEKEPENGGLPTTAVSNGLKYFLEIFIAQEFIDGWESNLKEKVSLEEKVARIIHYALHDA